MAESLGVVLPAYDPNVETLAAYVDALHDELSPTVVRIELDDPDARTQSVLEDLDATVNAVDGRRGKGAAITCGFEALAADVDVLAFADADGATPAPSMARVVAAVTGTDVGTPEATDGTTAGAGGDAATASGDGVDVAVGSRRHPDADVRAHQTFGRRYLGDAFAMLARSLLDVDLYDFQCGAKAMTTDAWLEVREHLYEAGFAWDVELIAVANARSLRIAEVPVTWLDQPDSTVSTTSTVYELGRCLLRSRHRMKQLDGSSVHGAIAARRSGRRALVDRMAVDTRED